MSDWRKATGELERYSPAWCEVMLPVLVAEAGMQRVPDYSSGTLVEISGKLGA